MYIFSEAAAVKEIPLSFTFHDLIDPPRIILHPSSESPQKFVHQDLLATSSGVSLSRPTERTGWMYQLHTHFPYNRPDVLGSGLLILQPFFWRQDTFANESPNQKCQDRPSLFEGF